MSSEISRLFAVLCQGGCKLRTLDVQHPNIMETSVHAYHPGGRRWINVRVLARLISGESFVSSAEPDTSAYGRQMWYSHMHVEVTNIKS